MSARAAEQAQPSPDREQLEQAGRRVKHAQEDLETAKREFLELYARFLRADPDFNAKSDAAERRLAVGPPWDDAFSPSELLEESKRPDR